jgi:flagellar protein FliO/FliZ
MKGTSISVDSFIASEARQSSALIKQAFLDRHVAPLLATTLFRSPLKFSGLTAASALLSLPILAHAAGIPADAPAPAVSTAGSLLQVFIGLVAVLLLIAATAWMAKRLGVTHGGTSSLLHVVSSASVGARERVVVVEVGESWLVVGVAPGSVNALMTLPKGEAPLSATSSLNASFAARLQQLVEKRREK